MTSVDPLEEQIADARRSISSDGYPMSIGEVTNMYKDGELRIRPEFQRFYRWSTSQKSKLIESLLLGIPLPSIFVAQTEDGKWELVDGLQRVSTILELQGELVGPGGAKLPHLMLEGTKYLKALEGRVWESDLASKSLSSAQRLDIKRSKLDIKIIKRESSPETKYDLFQRLNNYGTPLTSAEMRSALLVAVSSDFFAWLEGLARHPSFLETTQLSERLLEERYDLELVTRFLVLHNRPSERLTLTALRDLPGVLDDESVRLASTYPHHADDLGNIFRTTFDVIAEGGGENVFRKWDIDKNEFKGSFLNTAFEVFALGIGYHVANKNPYKTQLIGVVKAFWGRDQMKKGFATGRSTEARLLDFMPLGRQLTASANDEEATHTPAASTS